MSHIDTCRSEASGPAFRFPRLRRRGLLLGALAVVVARPARAEASIYKFDQTQGDIEFTAHHLGMLTSTGKFTRFDAEVRLDTADASRASVNVTVQTASLALDWPGAQDLLQSPDYFNSKAYPVAHFQGVSEGHTGGDAFAIKGDLSLRGVTRPFDMQGKLLARRFDPKLGAQVADFAAGGTLSRSAFGMTADPLMTGDEVRIDVRVSLQLAAGSAG